MTTLGPVAPRLGQTSATTAPMPVGARPRMMLAVAAVCGACTAVFVAIHFLLAREASRLTNPRFGTGRGAPASVRVVLRGVVEGSLGRFLAALFIGVALALVTRYYAAVALALLLAFAPVLAVLVSSRHALLPSGYPLTPAGLGLDWWTGRGVPGPFPLWRGAAIDWALALAPVLVLAWCDRRRAVAVWHRPPAIRVVAIVGAGFLGWLVLHTHELLAAAPQPLRVDAIDYAPFFLFGAALGIERTWKRVAVVLVPMLWASSFVPMMLLGHVHWMSPDDRSAIIPFVLVTLAGASWRLIERLLAMTEPSAMSLLVIVNALNVVDAVCTYFATTSGEASEANPFVHAVGLPVKLVIVLAASVLLARWKPRALVWTAVVLAGVVAWHVSGIVLASQ